MDIAGIVHVSAIFAVTLIVVVEIRLGRNSGTWVPLLTTLIGYIMPQPKLKNINRISNIAPDDKPDSADGHAYSCFGKMTSLLRVTWPSFLLVGSALAWLSLSVITNTGNLNETIA